MSAHFTEILHTFLLLLSLEVITVELCELQRITDNYKLDDSSGAILNVENIKMTFCSHGSAPKDVCMYCVPSRKHLVDVIYIQHSSGKPIPKKMYNETRCVCSKEKPITTEKESEGTFGTNECLMMMASSITLAVVCVGFSIVVIFLCLRYERCCKGSFKRRRQRDKNSNDVKKPEQNSSKPEAENSLIEKQQEADQV